MNLYEKTKMLLKNLIEGHKNDDCTCHTGRCSCQDKDKDQAMKKQGKTR